MQTAGGDIGFGARGGNGATGGSGGLNASGGGDQWIYKMDQLLL